MSTGERPCDHLCCDEPDNPFHDHFLTAAQCPSCAGLRPQGTERRCNHTEDGEQYCGDPACDIDFCQDCGEEYTDPCLRHAEVQQ